MVDDEGGTYLDWTVDDLHVESRLLGEPWRVLVQRPTHPADPAARRGLPWIWLLHGRTASAAEMRPTLSSIAAAIRTGDLPPAIVVCPDAPEDHRTSWWVDSDLVPPASQEAEIPRGRLLETSLLDEVRLALEAMYGAPSGPANRIISGISMGGGAALRWLLVRPDLFGSAVLLSPAVFEDLPVAGSAMRRQGVFDVEASIFDTHVYAELLHYPTLLAAIPDDRALTPVVILVGDEESIRSDQVGRHDLDLEAARLHAALKLHPAFRSSLRVVGGGHDWPVWERGVVTALRVLAGREPTTP
jgi:S-formylglutathione hydrolase FrmB